MEGFSKNTGDMEAFAVTDRSDLSPEALENE
jgi:hypothetical protein